MVAWGLMNGCSRYIRGIARETTPTGDIPTSMTDPLDRADTLSQGETIQDVSVGYIPPPDPRRVLSEAYDMVIRDELIPAGSSTACVMNLCCRTGNLSAAVLGDSVFCIIRDGRIQFRQTALQHYFNCPKQLTVLPGMRKMSREEGMDVPEDAESVEVQVYDGDLVLVGTDGLWDNMHDGEIEQHCEELTMRMLKSGGKDEVSERGLMKAFVENMVQQASVYGMDPKRQSPWAKEARLQGYGNVIGGKMDDVTLVAAWVHHRHAAR